MAANDNRRRRPPNQAKRAKSTEHEAVDSARVADEVSAIFRELQRRGGIDDVFERLPEAERRHISAIRPKRPGRWVRQR